MNETANKQEITMKQITRTTAVAYNFSSHDPALHYWIARQVSETGETTWKKITAAQAAQLLKHYRNRLEILNDTKDIFYQTVFIIKPVPHWESFAQTVNAEQPEL